MQFIVDGPDIPDEFIFAHQEGKIVFFCGAEISRPIKLLSLGGSGRVKISRKRESSDKSYIRHFLVLPILTKWTPYPIQWLL